jgi:transposase
VDKHLDLSVFDARYNNDETGATAIHPSILLKVILLVYARGMISSRQTRALPGTEPQGQCACGAHLPRVQVVVER